jgi:hypothetical protein
MLGKRVVLQVPCGMQPVNRLFDDDNRLICFKTGVESEADVAFIFVACFEHDKLWSRTLDNEVVTRLVQIANSKRCEPRCSFHVYADGGCFRR